MFLFYALQYVGNVYILELEKICEGIKLRVWDLLLITFNGEGNGNLTPVHLPGKFHGLRSLVGYSPWGRKESDTTEQLHFSLSLSDIFTVYKNNSIFISTNNTPSGLRHSSPISKNQSRIQYSLLRILKKHLRIKFGALQ